MEDESPLIRMANVLLLRAVEAGADKVEIRSAREGGAVLFAINGEIVEETVLPQVLAPVIVRRFAIMANLPVYAKDEEAQGLLHLRVRDTSHYFAIRVWGHGAAQSAALRPVAGPRAEPLTLGEYR